LSQLFASEVDYYGNKKQRIEVVKDKLDFFARWPVRQYTLEPGSLSVSCEREVCYATGMISWVMTSPARGSNSTGSAEFTLDMSLESGAPLISRETLAIKSRKVAANSAHVSPP
jgi:hypothetical protein